MKMTHWILLGAAFLGAACARVQVEAPKEPIKMDISMRLDVYQHIAKDVDAIESIVRGKDEVQTAWAEWLVPTAYAADELPPAVRETALRRRGRFATIEDLERRGVLGESKDGLLVLRDASRSDLTALIEEENKDREFTFAEVAKLDNTTVDQVRHVFSLRFRNQAPAGAPIQNEDGSWSTR